jgi:hypothetical protein
VLWIPLGQLLDPRDDDLELETQLLQDLPPLRGSGCEDDLQNVR